MQKFLTNFCCLDTYFTSNKAECCSIKLNGKLVNIEHPQVAAIVNCTPDSFYQPNATQPTLTLHSDVLLADIGGCSTRPGGQLATEEEETTRLLHFVPQFIAHNPNTPLSIDTFRPGVAACMLERFPISIINDVSGGNQAMYELAAAHQVGYVLTYPQGGSISDALYYFSAHLDALARAGVCDILLDPGFGFGKTMEQNYALAREMSALKTFGLPLFVGVSRKSMVQKTLNCTASEALNGTTALHALLLAQGADILRVHDVKEAVETIRIFNQFCCSNYA